MLGFNTWVKIERPVSLKSLSRRASASHLFLRNVPSLMPVTGNVIFPQYNQSTYIAGFEMVTCEQISINSIDFWFTLLLLLLAC